MASVIEVKPETYLNPVCHHSFPDPFVLKFRGQYFAYSTGFAPDGNVFAVMRSDDLVKWTELGSAMKRLEPSPPYYWAPEVTYDNGRFYLYYSTGNETLMELRVAVSDRPDGGFIDSGKRLTREDFAIDAHVFIDDDGTHYMVYATDFLEHTHIGTGTVIDRMVDLFTLEGRPRPVTRAKYDWQVYDPARKEKGGVRWHTVEGPSILKRKGRYYEMFSGGNWKNMTYGVSFAMTDDLNSDQEWQQFADGEKILPILRTIPDKVVGPGHNSVIRGPNNRELYCIYHRWTDAGRVLAIDRMDFAGDRIFVAGPTTTPQPAPFLPAAIQIRESHGQWKKNGNEFVSNPTERCELTFDLPGGDFLSEVTFRLSDRLKSARAGFVLETPGGRCEFAILPDKARALFDARHDQHDEIEFPPDLDLTTFHLLRIEHSPGSCLVQLDDRSRKAAVELDGHAGAIKFFSENVALELSALEMTAGFEEDFSLRESLPAHFTIEGGSARLRDRCLWLTPAAEATATVRFRVPYGEFELAVNLALQSGDRRDEYGITLLDRERRPLVRFTARPQNRVMALEVDGQPTNVNLPDSFVGTEFRQFRLVLRSGTMTAYLDGIELAQAPCRAEITDAAIISTSTTAIDMIRLTGI
jgi:GH43 family beta-xylosidase